MDHNYITQDHTFERYLLDDLTPEVRDEFEEHFFDCQECATDLRATAAFMDAAKREFRIHPVEPGGDIKGKSFFASAWPSALVWSALAASLLVIAYQNMIVFPHFRTEISELKAPEILPAISLVRGNSRGGQIPAGTVGNARPFLLQLDLPTQDRFSSYTCLLYAPSGVLIWRTEVSAQSARDTVSIRVPPADRPPGEYTLAVQGNIDRGENPVDLGHYPFALNTQ
jgi:hypothetical protein